MKKMILLIIISLFVLFPVSNGFSTQNASVFWMSNGHFLCVVDAPIEAKTGEAFSIGFSIRPVVTIQVDRIFVEVYGNIGYDGNWSYWNYTWQSMTMYESAQYKQEKTTFVRSLDFSGESVGGVYGTILAAYDWNGQRYSDSANFAITKVYSKTYSEIMGDLTSLNQTYQNLQIDNKSAKDGLALYQNVSAALVIVTIVLVCTTVFFAIRKSKSKTSNTKSPTSLDTT